jgi:hypothetical protein
MNTITLHRASSSGCVVPACRPRVVVAGRRDRNLEALSLEWLSGPEFGEATVTAVRTGHTPRPPRAEELPSLPAVGQRVALRNPVGLAEWEFRGVVAAHEVTLDGERERLVARLRHELADALAGPIEGCVVWDGVALHHRSAERTRFNAGAGTWASPERYEVNGRSVRVFSTCDDAVRWSAADALAYLLAVHGAGIPVTAATATVEQAGEVDPGRLDVSGKPAAEAIAAVARRAGLILRVGRGGNGLVVQPRGQGATGEVRLAPAGGTVSAAGSNLWQAVLDLGPRPARRGVLVLGDTKRYEATFELSPGWDPYVTPDTWSETVRSRSADWPGAADVLRRWVLNEDGAYSDAPWNLPVHGFGDVCADDFTLVVARRLEACLSVDEQGRSLGVVVELSVDAGATWRPWSGPMRVADGRCDVVLGGDELPGDYFRAALAGEAKVRVTATVASDSRLTVEIEGDAPAGRDVVAAEAMGRWAKVSPQSVFAGAEGPGRSREEDDTPVLEAIARRHVETSSGVDATLTLPQVEPVWAVGDVVHEVAGRRLGLSGAPGMAPQVVRVRHEFDDSQRTILTAR